MNYVVQLLGIVVFAISFTACTQSSQVSTASIEDTLDFEPSQQFLQFEDMRDGYYLQFAKKPIETREWCQKTIVEQKPLFVGVNVVSRICLEADNRYYLD